MTVRPESDGMEEELVRRAQIGDLFAFDRLVQRYRKGCVWQAKQLTTSQEVAEDAVQEAFCSAYKALPKLSNPAAFPAWLGAIVRNTALRLAKGDSKSWSPIDSIILAHAPSLHTELEQRAELSEISEGIAELDLDLKLSLELYYLEGWSVKRISGFTSLPESTIKWRLHTGRRLLRLKLSHMMEDRK